MTNVRSVVRLLSRAILLLAVVASTVAAILAIPAKNHTFLDVLVMKQARLQKLPPGKIVLIGGSNLAFGVDSARLESAVGRNVINMGLHAGLGLRFMLAQAQNHLEAGDIVLISPEYELFEEKPTESVVCQAAALLRDGWQLLPPPQRIPCVLTDSVRRAQDNVVWLLRRELRLPNHDDPRSYLSAYNERGDVITHLGLPGKSLQEMPSLPAEIRFREDVLRTLVSFVASEREKGTIVVLAYPPLAADLFHEDEPAIKRLDAVLRKRLPSGTVISRPGDLVMSRTAFYDTPYHLTGAARQIRTDRLIDLLRPFAISRR